MFSSIRRSETGAAFVKVDAPLRPGPAKVKPRRARLVSPRGCAYAHGPGETRVTDKALQRTGRAMLIAIVVVAIGIRAAFATQTVVYHADEVWQYLEPAYGLVTGRWVQAWEFHEGIRGWFVPVLLAGPIALGHALAPESSLHLVLVRMVLALAALGVPLAWYDLARPAGRGPALVAGWVGAIWCECVYFAPRTGAEGLALTVLFPAIALAARVRQREAPRWMTLALGLLLALGVIVRFQYLPAIGLVALWAIVPDWRRVLPRLIAGGLMGLGIGALCDALAGHAPLVWIWNSVRTNLVEGRSEMFGTQPPQWLILTQLHAWGWASVLIVPAALWGARRRPVLLAAALAIYAAHSAIAHKEYRFVLLGGTLLVMLAAIGSAEAIEALARRQRRPAAPWLGLLALVWTAASLAMATGPFFRDLWVQGDMPFGAQIVAGEQPGVCGVAAYQAHAHPLFAASFINRPVPLLLFDGPEAPLEAAAMRSRFNVVMASRLAGATLPADYRLVECHHQEELPEEDQDACLFVRPGSCRGAVGDFAYQPAMERRGK